MCARGIHGTQCAQEKNEPNANILLLSTRVRVDGNWTLVVNETFPETFFF